MAFGARKMLYKLDFGTMIGSELDLDEIASSRETNFTWFCILEEVVQSVPHSVNSKSSLKAHGSL